MPTDPKPGRAVPLILALTGGIASGKSLVAAQLEELGAAVLDADQVYHELLEGPLLRDELRRAFGDRFFGPDERLDRRALGAHVFADRAALERLNALTHPAVSSAIEERVRALLAAPAPPPLIVLAVPLLFEVGWRGPATTVAVVACPEELQVQRLMARGKLDRSAALARIAAQLPLSEKVRRADHVIDNAGSVEATRAQVQALFERLTAQR